MLVITLSCDGCVLSRYNYMLHTSSALSKYSSLQLHTLILTCIYSFLFYMQVKFSLLDKPKQLSLNAFSWDDNYLSLLFRGCGDGAGFLKIWGIHIKPYLNTASGAFSPSSPATSSRLSSVTNSAGQSSQTSTLRKRPSTTPPNLMPATKTARLQQEQTAVLSDADSSTKEMDEEIAQHFLGELHAVIYYCMWNLMCTCIRVCMCGVCVWVHCVFVLVHSCMHACFIIIL